MKQYKYIEDPFAISRRPIPEHLIDYGMEKERIEVNQKSYNYCKEKYINPLSWNIKDLYAAFEEVIGTPDNLKVKHNHYVLKKDFYKSLYNFSPQIFGMSKKTIGCHLTKFCMYSGIIARRVTLRPDGEKSPLTSALVFIVRRDDL